MLPAYDIICIGAGPTGLACAIEARRAGLRPLVIDKGCLCNSLYHYPANMKFFTTAERMEIGDLPMTVGGDKPTRVEALKYYRRAAEHFDLDVHLYETFLTVSGKLDDFTMRTRDNFGIPHEYRAARIIFATGYYDLPNRLGIPGEDLPCVSHYYTDPQPYWRQDVVVIGAKNSAAEAALDLFRGGARVTLVHRGASLGASLKYWVRPDIENRIAAGEIRALFNTEVTRIEPGRVWVRPAGYTNGILGDACNAAATQAGPARRDEASHRNEQALPSAHVFAMTGYHPDFSLLESVGIHLDRDTRKPECNPVTHESNVPGIYVAGVLLGGLHTGEIFIENGRFHGKQIISAITGASAPLGHEPVAPPGE
jgi:thioredoxin reductase (NADPH)